MLRDNFIDNIITREPQVKSCLKTPGMIGDFSKLSIELHPSSKCGLESAVKPVPGKDGGGGSDGGGDGDAGGDDGGGGYLSSSASSSLLNDFASLTGLNLGGTITGGHSHRTSAVCRAGGC